jgi:hypothetical protein
MQYQVFSVAVSVEWKLLEQGRSSFRTFCVE